jgi:Fungal chitosanase of glycosyl hydrolase group 75
MLYRLLFALLLLVAASTPAGAPSAPDAPGATAAATSSDLPNLAHATPVDAALQSEYARCDREDAFGELTFPFVDRNGNKWFPCRSDPSHLEKLVQLPAAAPSRVAVLFTSKLAVDRDGSWIACNKAGITDQCGTALMLPATTTHKCVVPDEAASRCVPVPADRVPYVALPLSGPPDVTATAFRDKTGIHVGDLGVVIRDGHAAVPVIVADTGPFYKVGEGSIALHAALGNDVCKARDDAGNCTESGRDTSIASGIVTIIFPGSRPVDLTPDTIAATVQERGSQLYQNLLQAYPPETH